MKKSLGFTLVELMISVTIISVLATVGVSKFKDYKYRTMVKSVNFTAGSYAKGLDLYKVQHGQYPVPTGGHFATYCLTLDTDFCTSGDAAMDSFSLGVINPMPRVMEGFTRTPYPDHPPGYLTEATYRTARVTWGFKTMNPAHLDSPHMNMISSSVLFLLLLVLFSCNATLLWLLLLLLALIVVD